MPSEVHEVYYAWPMYHVGTQTGRSATEQVGKNHAKVVRVPYTVNAYTHGWLSSWMA